MADTHTGAPANPFNWHSFIALAMIYIVFAIMLNSVGTVIAQSIKFYSVTKSEASILEGFKDLPIAIISFFAASSLPYFGFKRAIGVGLGLIFLGNIAMLTIDSFWAPKLLYLTTGLGFGLAKVAVYASVGLLAADRSKHSSLMNLLEGLFMVGVLSGYWVFAGFIDETDHTSTSWLNAFGVLAGLTAVTFLVVMTAPLKTPATNANLQANNTDTNLSEQASPVQTSRFGHLLREFADMLQLAAVPLTIVFILSIFMYVLIEQSIGTWLPTFNREVLALSPQLSVKAASIYAAGLAIGRLGAGIVLRYVRWDHFLSVSLAAIAALVLLTLPLSQGLSGEIVYTWSDAPIAAYLFPLIGILMAPLYPALNSHILTSLPIEKHAAMTGLIVVFSALGGTTGSFITGYVFEHFTGQTAFYLTLVPLSIILVCVQILWRYRKKMPSAQESTS